MSAIAVVVSELDEAIADVRTLGYTVHTIRTPQHLDPCGVCSEDEEAHPIRDADGAVLMRVRGRTYRTPVCAGHLADEVRYQRVTNGLAEITVEVHDRTTARAAIAAEVELARLLAVEAAAQALVEKLAEHRRRGYDHIRVGCGDTLAATLGGAA